MVIDYYEDKSQEIIAARRAEERFVKKLRKDTLKRNPGLSDGPTLLPVLAFIDPRMNAIREFSDYLWRAVLNGDKVMASENYIERRTDVVTYDLTQGDKWLEIIYGNDCAGFGLDTITSQIVETAGNARAMIVHASKTYTIGMPWGNELKDIAVSLRIFLSYLEGGMAPVNMVINEEIPNIARPADLFPSPIDEYLKDVA